MKKRIHLGLFLGIGLLMSSLSACGLQGAVGPEGPKGDAGQIGPQGPAGSNGKDGRDGSNGKDGADGKDGKDGSDGKDGKDGADGLPGADGATWLTGSGAPSSSSGVDGDLFLDTETYDLFLKTNGEWSNIGNIKGADGQNAETYGLTYTITFDSLGGELINSEETIVAKYGDTIVLPEAERENFIFTGWYTGFGINDGKFTSTTPVTKNIVLYAGWEAEQSFTVYFHTNGGSTIETIQYQNNTSVASLPSPSKIDYAFYGWYYDEGLAQRVTYPFTISKDLDLYAKWVDAYYEISFDTMGGLAIDSESYIAGTELTELPTPSKNYYSFAGWYLDSGYVAPATLPFELHENMTLYAKWNTTNSTIRFNSNLGSDVANKIVTTGSYLTADNMPSPTRKDYTFAGWYTNPGLTVPVSYPYLVNGDVTFYAKWNDDYAGFTRISTLAQLKSISSMSGNYLLTQDIDCLGQALTMIGTTNSPFSGIFEGANHRISNFTLSAKNGETENYGLFVSNTGIIRNLKLSGGTMSLGTIYGNSSNDSIASFGGLTGTNSGTISRVSVDVGINATSDSYASKYYVGGIAGRNKSGGNINNCLFTGHINTTLTGCNSYNKTRHYVGGICGDNSTSTISKCVYAGSMESTCDYRGSHYISGIANNGSLVDCLALKEFTTSYMSSDAVSYGGTLTNCYKYSGLTVSTTNGNSASSSQINSSSFYENTLHYSSAIWDYESLNYNYGTYVSLR